MKQIYLYDDDKMFIGTELIEETAENTVDNAQYILPENATFQKPQDGLYKAKFDGENWLETITETELQKLNRNASIFTNTERLDALEGAIVDLANSIL